MNDKEANNEKRLMGMTKRRLRDFNIEEARGWTINTLQEIEHRIDFIIIDYFKPANEHTFKKIVLNSSILDIGSKLKILMNIGTVDSETIEKIRKLAAIRNGFAHAPMTENVKVNIDITNDKSSVTPETMIEVMNSQGKIVPKIAVDYLVDFLALDKEIREKI